MSDEQPAPDESDAVLIITLYKADPHCLEYVFKVDSKYGQHEPEHLEQLNVMHDIIDKHIKRAEQAALQDMVMKKRELRKAQADYFANLPAEKGVPN